MDGLGAWELHIERDRDRYSYLLASSKVGTIAFVDHARVPSQVRAQLLTAISSALREFGRQPRSLGTQSSWHAVDASRLAELGSLVFRRLLTSDLQAVLSSMPAGFLTISSNDPAIPWELAFDGSDHIGRKFAVGRRVHARVLPMTRVRPPKPWLEFLLLADPTVDLPQAAAEAEAIVDALANEPLVRLTRLSGKDATIARVTDKIDSGHFDVVHFAGHVEYDRERSEESTLRFADGRMAANYLCQLFGEEPPEIVFLNGCATAREEESTLEHRRGELSGLAGAFLEAGVEAYLGTLWMVEDEVARKIAVGFYKAVLNEEPVGLALRTSRHAISEEDSEAGWDWGAYLLFGRPDYVLQSVRLLAERRRRLHTLRGMLKSQDERQRRRAAVLLGELGHPEAADLLAEALTHDSTPVRWRAAEALAKINTRDSIAALVGLLPVADPDMQVHIMILIRGSGQDVDFRPFIRLLDKRNDPQVRWHACITLGWVGDSSIIGGLRQVLREDDEMLQWAAVEAIARIGGRRAKATLLNFQPTHPALLRKVEFEVERIS